MQKANWKLVFGLALAAAAWWLAGIEGLGPAVPGYAAGLGPASGDRTEAGLRRQALTPGQQPADVISAGDARCDPQAAIPPEEATTGTAMATQSISNDSTAQEATFRLCGGPDPQTERAIEQLIAGRGFSATLISRPDGCADLTLRVTSAAPGGGARQSATMTVSAGSGGRISVRIISEQGTTRVSIGA